MSPANNINVLRSPRNVSDFNPIWDFSTDFSYKFTISNFVEIRPTAASLIHAGSRTDMKKLKGLFRDYATAPKIHSNKCWGIQTASLNKQQLRGSRFGRVRTNRKPTIEMVALWTVNICQLNAFNVTGPKTKRITENA